MKIDFNGTLAHTAPQTETLAVINIGALRAKRKHLKSQISSHKRLMRSASRDEALRLGRAIEDANEHIVIINLMISNQAFAVQSLYMSSCYGPVQ